MIKFPSDPQFVINPLPADFDQPKRVYWRVRRFTEAEKTERVEEAVSALKALNERRQTNATNH
jgi:hypothetical protein